MTQQEVFNAAYWASKDPEVRKLKDMENRKALAADLARQGFAINMWIEYHGFDPYSTMTMLKQYGYTWISRLFGTPMPNVAPGVSLPGYPQYDPNHPPADAIKISTDLSDYPPFDKVPPPPPVKPINPVGSLADENAYYDLCGPLFANGAEWTDERGKFVKHVKQGPVYLISWWEKVA